MEPKTLGKTGLRVNPLGIGLSAIGHLGFDTSVNISQLLNSALDLGINFFDTAPCYNDSEKMLGDIISHRRSEYILATKAGHDLPRGQGIDWTYKVIIESVDRSLKRMRTDHIDLLQLHSCDVSILKRGDVIRAIQDVQKAGKTRWLGYSGDNKNAKWAIRSNLFDTIQTSFNLVDQKARQFIFPEAQRMNMGIIIKRPMGNGAWGTGVGHRRKVEPNTEEYFRRADLMRREGSGAVDQPENPVLLALGFTFAHSEIDVAIVGTTNPSHLKSNLEMMEDNIPISSNTVTELHRRFDSLGSAWDQRQGAETGVLPFSPGLGS